MVMSSMRSTLFITINLLLLALSIGLTNGNHLKTIPNPNPNYYPSLKSCPRDTLKLGICAKVLNGPINAVIGTPPDPSCCYLLGGLVELEAALCLCTAIKANILGINLNIPIALSLLINTCGTKLPPDFQCA